MIGELQLQTCITVTFRYAILCELTHITQKTQVTYGHSTYRMAVVLLEMSIFWVRAANKLQFLSYGCKHASQSLPICNLCMLTPVTWKLQVVYGSSTYQTTALLLEMVLLWFRVTWEIWLESYDHKHTSKLYSDTILCVHCKYKQKNRSACNPTTLHLTLLLPRMILLVLK